MKLEPRKNDKMGVFTNEGIFNETENPFQLAHAESLFAESPGVSEDSPMIYLSNSPPRIRSDEGLAKGQVCSFRIEEFDSLYIPTSTKFGSCLDDMRQLDEQAEENSPQIPEDSPMILLSDSPPRQCSDDGFPTEERSAGIDEFDELRKTASPRRGSCSEDMLQLSASDKLRGDQIFYTREKCREIEDFIEAFIERMEQVDEGFDDLITTTEIRSEIVQKAKKFPGTVETPKEWPLLVEIDTESVEIPKYGPVLIEIEHESVEIPKATLTLNKHGAEESTAGGGSKVEDIELKSIEQISAECKKMGKERFVNWNIRPTPGTITVHNTTVYQFKICNVNGPGLFYMQSECQLEALNELENEMTKWYHEYFWEKHLTLAPRGNPGGNGPVSFNHMSFPLQNGGYYAAFVKEMQKWVRCTAEKVDGLGDGNEVLIHLLDHGTQSLVADYMILPLRSDYLELPIQAYCGKLHDLDNKSVRMGISVEKKFREATEGQRFLVVIMDIDEQGLASMSKLSVVLLEKMGIWEGAKLFSVLPAPGYKKTH